MGEVMMNPILEILYEIGWGIVFLVVLLVGYRLSMRWLNNYAKRHKMPPEAKNGLVLVIRLGALFTGVLIVMAALDVSAQFMVSLAAIIGAAIGFASQQTLGNFVSGIYLILTRPFRVGDYLRLGSSGSTEGVVREITINYTKIQTSDNTHVIISNLEVLSSEMKNCRIKEGETSSYRYGIELAFAHSLTTQEIEDILDQIVERYKGKFFKPSTYEMTALTHLAMKYVFFVQVKDPEEIFVFSSQITKEITQAMEKTKSQKQ